MTREKKERILLASVVTAIVLFFILVSIVTYQLIKISSRKKQLNSLKVQIRELQEEKQKTQEGIDMWKIEDLIKDMARYYDLKFPEDK